MCQPDGGDAEATSRNHQKSLRTGQRGRIRIGSARSPRRPGSARPLWTASSTAAGRAREHGGRGRPGDRRPRPATVPAAAGRPHFRHRRGDACARRGSRPRCVRRWRPSCRRCARLRAVALPPGGGRAGGGDRRRRWTGSPCAGRTGVVLKAPDHPVWWPPSNGCRSRDPGRHAGHRPARPAGGSPTWASTTARPGATAAYLIDQWLGDAAASAVTLSSDGVPGRGRARDRLPGHDAELAPPSVTRRAGDRRARRCTCSAWSVPRSRRARTSTPSTPYGGGNKAIVAAFAALGRACARVRRA